MLKIQDMTAEEMKMLLYAKEFGHLGCSFDGRPYVVPMHYVFNGEFIYFLTTEGQKTEYMTANDEVCFQVEDILKRDDWRSVIVIGHAERITHPEEKERAMQIITARNPSLTPALNITEVDAWTRENNIAIYKIYTSIMDGRKTVGHI
jgi:nitroimidazol reductase NimA-like FMN-containing flavoprotein (pyridoxamine 5'-phosphate oxidase superfamily)